MPSRRVLVTVAAVLGALLAAALVVTAAVAAVRTVSSLVSAAPTPAPTSTPPSAGSRQGSQVRPVRASVGTPVLVAGARMTVLRTDGGARPPASLRVPADDRFVAVRVRYQGAAGATAIVSPYDWVITDSSGSVHVPVVDGLTGALPERELRSGQTVEGDIGFVVPATAQELVLVFDAERGDASAEVSLGRLPTRPAG